MLRGLPTDKPGNGLIVRSGTAEGELPTRGNPWLLAKALCRSSSWVPVFHDYAHSVGSIAPTKYLVL